MQCPKCKREIPDDARLCCYCGKKIIPDERKIRRRPNAAGTVWRMKGKRVKPWAATRRHVFLGSYATRREALAALDQTIRRPSAELRNMTVSEVWEIWKSERFDDFADKTQEAYLYAWDLLQHIHGRKLSDVRTADVQPIVDRAVRDGASRSKTEKIRGLYSQLCQWGMREDILEKNYATFLRLPKQKTPDRPTFTVDDRELLKKDAATSETSKLILILIYTGFRINELLQLPLSGVKLDEGLLIGGEKTEAGKNRAIPILPVIEGYVQYFADRASGALLISGYEGNHDAKNWRRRNYYPTLERLGIRTEERPMKPHSTRYTFATMAAEAGVKQTALQKIMGHAKFSTTSDIYVQKDVDMIKAEMGKIS